MNGGEDESLPNPCPGPRTETEQGPQGRTTIVLRRTNRIALFAITY